MMIDEMDGCLFCKIVANEVPSTAVAESEDAYAFEDINPQAPVHVLVVPRRHVTSAHEVSAAEAHLLGEVVLLAQQVAMLKGIDAADRGYRLVMNVGPDAQMSVAHLHLHVLGGRSLDGRLG